MNRRARTLRKNQTDAEQHLWRHLRNRELAEHKFRRQHPIGRYVVDFVCTEQRLVVEVDGGQHDEQRAYDRVRTRELEAAGYRVLRFWNHEVLRETEAVLDAILMAAGEEEKRGFAGTPSSRPSPPMGEKGQEAEGQIPSAPQPFSSPFPVDADGTPSSSLSPFGADGAPSSSLSPTGGEGWGEGDQ